MKGFAEALSRAMAADAPNLFTANAIKSQRRGKIYLDYLRNARGASATASYSLAYARVEPLRQQRPSRPKVRPSRRCGGAF